MICKLCEQEIQKYSSEINDLLLNEVKTVNICRGCIDIIVKWQQKKYATLFPTKKMKKMYKSEG